MESNHKSYFLRPELLENIFIFLDLKNSFQLINVCKLWNKMLRSSQFERFWKLKYEKELPNHFFRLDFKTNEELLLNLPKPKHEDWFEIVKQTLEFRYSNNTQKVRKSQWFFKSQEDIYALACKIFYDLLISDEIKYPGKRIIFSLIIFLNVEELINANRSQTLFTANSYIRSKNAPIIFWKFVKYDKEVQREFKSFSKIETLFCVNLFTTTKPNLKNKKLLAKYNNEKLITEIKMKEDARMLNEIIETVQLIAELVFGDRLKVKKLDIFKDVLSYQEFFETYLEYAKEMI